MANARTERTSVAVSMRPESSRFPNHQQPKERNKDHEFNRTNQSHRL